MFDMNGGNENIAVSEVTPMEKLIEGSEGIDEHLYRVAILNLVGPELRDTSKLATEQVSDIGKVTESEIETALQTALGSIRVQYDDPESFDRYVESKINDIQAKFTEALFRTQISTFEDLYGDGLVNFFTPFKKFHQHQLDGGQRGDLMEVGVENHMQYKNAQAFVKTLEAFISKYSGAQSVLLMRGCITKTDMVGQLEFNYILDSAIAACIDTITRRDMLQEDHIARDLGVDTTIRVVGNTVGMLTDMVAKKYNSIFRSGATEEGE